MKFKVTYPSGLTEEVSSDCESVEAYCAQHFGSTWETALEHGASVEIIAKSEEPSAAVVPTETAPEPAESFEVEAIVAAEGEGTIVIQAGISETSEGSVTTA